MNFREQKTVAKSEMTRRESLERLLNPLGRFTQGYVTKDQLESASAERAPNIIDSFMS